MSAIAVPSYKPVITRLTPERRPRIRDLFYTRAKRAARRESRRMDRQIPLRLV